MALLGLASFIDLALINVRHEARPKAVDPIDYETFVVKNKLLLQNDPQREILNFPHDDIELPTPTKKIRTVHSTVPRTANQEATCLFVQDCINFYTGSCHAVKYKYDKYAGSYQQLPNVKQTKPLKVHVFEIDAEEDEKDDDISSRSSISTITKVGWLYKGPDGGKENIISFTRQFKRRFFCLKQQKDFTYALEFYKDEKRSETKGIIFLEVAQEAVRNTKRGKASFEVRVNGRPSYVFSAESEADADDWVLILNRVISAAETSSMGSVDRSRDDTSLGKPDDRPGIDGMHPELAKYSREKESEALLYRARQEERQNLFSVYPSMNPNFLEEEDDRQIEDGQLNIYPKQLGERFLLNLHDFQLKLRVDLGEEGHSRKTSNPEPFFITFALYDGKEGKKISEDFHIDPNEPEIRAMIPSEIVHASDKLHSVDGLKTSPEINGLNEKWLLNPKRQAIFSVILKHSEVYLYAKIEKVLQGSISQGTDSYLRAPDMKMGSKVHRQMKQFCQHIGHYRMPFGWAARPLSTLPDLPVDLTIYKQESNRLSEDEVLRHLQDLRKPEKQGKWQVIPGSLKISFHPISPGKPLQNTLTSTYIPVKPFPDPPTDRPALEVETFPPDRAKYCDPHNYFTSNLYVYPLSLKFDNQKTFTKARNIACCVEIRESDDDSAPPLKRIYGSPGVSLFTTVASTAVSHHNTLPEFNEEVKISLPVQLNERHHLLFRFFHVSCEGSKSGSRVSSGTGKKKDHIEIPVGYSWLPLLQDGRVVVGEQHIPVAASLPSRYLSFDVLSMGKGVSGPELKWVDGGKPLFKVKLGLHSTVYTKDQHLQNFFHHCQKMENSMMPSIDLESTNKLKSLHAVDVSVCVQFLPILLNRLFSLLAKTNSEEVSINTVRVLIHIVSEIHEADKVEALETYVKYVFRTEPVPKGSKQKSVHDELARNLTAILRPANADPLVVSKFLQHSWFFFEILNKSMTQFLVDSGRVKMPRNERFSSDYQYRIQNLAQTIAHYIMQKYKEQPRETKNANHSLAFFIKMCFCLMDRGFVFQLVAAHMDNFGAISHKVLQESKFEFLRIVCSHEHYIPLCLPLLRRGNIKNFTDMRSDYMLSEEFRRNHYLVGLLLQELKFSLTEPRDIRRSAITVLRNQIAKHAFDDRYTAKHVQARVVALYLPFITILIENKARLSSHANTPTQPPPPIPNGSISSSQVTIRAHPPSIRDAKSMVMDTPKRDSTVFAMIAGQGTPHLHLGPEELKTKLDGSANSLTSSTSSLDKAEKEPVKDHPVDKSHQRAQSMGGSGPAGPLLPHQKLDLSEIKDLLLCFLYIVKHLSEDILKGWFNNSSEFDVIDFFSVLEICLQQFKYVGRKKICTLSAIGDSRKALTMPSSRRSMPYSYNSSIKTMSQPYLDMMFFFPTAHTQSDSDAMMRANQEANMATEVGLVVLDILSLYSHTFKKDLEQRNGDNVLMRRVFDLYLFFLQTSQSEALQKHMFGMWRAFIRKYPSVIFSGNAAYCGELCYELLRCCNSRLSSSRKEACALLYLLMRANFEFTKKKGFIRVHLQVIISVSQLIGDVVGLSNPRFQESLAIVNSYASSDKEMRRTSFPGEVKDLTKRIRTVLMATAQMKEHENDPEMLIDLQYSLAKSYTSTPELRKTWLDSMAKIHNRNQNYSEAAHCYIHIAALVAEYLRRRGKMKS
ncbi:hypothetical protein ScPMuIL_018063, partial [Solemya velum]